MPSIKLRIFSSLSAAVRSSASVIPGQPTHANAASRLPGSESRVLAARQFSIRLRQRPTAITRLHGQAAPQLLGDMCEKGASIKPDLQRFAHSKHLASCSGSGIGVKVAEFIKQLISAATIVSGAVLQSRSSLRNRLVSLAT